MKRFLSCIKGESSNSAAQDAQVVFDDEPYGHNQELNDMWRDGLEIPADRRVEEPNAPLFPTTPALPANCGPSYQWHEIIDATINFRQDYLLGRGDFGEVYRVNFSRTNESGAVKIQARNDAISHAEFLAEVTTLHAANHPNVIKLLGKCYGRRNRALVYEVMSNASLDRHILVNKSLKQPARFLDWGTRMKIALGVAEGLVYVHEELKVIHRDLKAENILLDENFVPKLTDFGLATKIIKKRNGTEKQSEVNVLKGTRGYIAPEAEQSQLVSTKSDVYSYGVLLLVLFTGMKAFDKDKKTAEKQKLTDVFMQIRTRMGSEPEDVAFGGKYSVEGLNRIYDIARMCIYEEPLARPPMSHVAMMVRQAAVFPVRVGFPVVERRHSARV